MQYTMREQLGISAEHLCACLQEHYHLIPAALDFLPLGLDYRAGVYRIVSEQGASYLLKVRSGTLYEPGCLVPAYLSDQGITSVVAPLPTRNHALWARREDWTVIVYPFLEGETSWRGMTDEQWKETGSIFKQIHQVAPPSSGFESLRKETFDPTGYAQWIRIFETQHLHASSGESTSRQALRSSWIENQATIHAVVASLEQLAVVLHRRNLPYVICHADLHPANLLRDRTGRVFVIDWDEVMLAPKERDFLFIKESPTDSETLPGTPAFFQGYGQADLDWIALTYYRYERVIQDVIACAENVCLRDDLGEESRADEAQLFQDVLAEGGEIDAATQASAHLSPDLTIPIRRNA
ncbi:aminoglycoside phosphotransferase [Ktedonobacter racemifer DSM 44963]|uniref:Aminoglycoside phosphotransferase n=2 Tax=Ktedonobacter racemifer TaxID=363277 RepID=D6TV75_KTERA|nr:aminoglycoside phosphotransferase [Ktedonobacter racemifer DSM 44963]